VSRIALVKSSNGKIDYVISVRDDQWQCSCVGWTRHVPRKDCKHIRGCKDVSNEKKSKLTINWTDYGLKHYVMNAEQRKAQAAKAAKEARERKKYEAQIARRRIKDRKEAEARAKKHVAERLKREAEEKVLAEKRAIEEKAAAKKKLLEDAENNHDSRQRFRLLEMD